MLTQIYLVGDIIDGWRLKSGWYFPQSHNDVIAEAAAQGAQGLDARSILPATTATSCAISPACSSAASPAGRRDHPRDRGRQAPPDHPWRPVRSRGAQRQMARRCCGDWAYTIALARSTRRSTRCAAWLQLPHWSLSAWAKHKVKNAVNYIGEFETCLAAEARRHERGRRGLRPYPPRGLSARSTS